MALGVGEDGHAENVQGWAGNDSRGCRQICSEGMADEWIWRERMLAWRAGERVHFERGSLEKYQGDAMSERRQFEFDARTTQYSAQNAYWLGAAANLAYENKATIEATTAQWGLDGCSYIDIDETQAFVAGNEEMI